MVPQKVRPEYADLETIDKSQLRSGAQKADKAAENERRISENSGIDEKEEITGKPLTMSAAFSVSKKLFSTDAVGASIARPAVKHRFLHQIPANT